MTAGLPSPPGAHARPRVRPRSPVWRPGRRVVGHVGYECRTRAL